MHEILTQLRDLETSLDKVVVYCEAIIATSEFKVLAAERDLRSAVLE